jgi:hypothetical protein
MILDELKEKLYNLPPVDYANPDHTVQKVVEILEKRDETITDVIKLLINKVEDIENGIREV